MHKYDIFKYFSSLYQKEIPLTKKGLFLFIIKGLSQNGETRVCLAVNVNVEENIF